MPRNLIILPLAAALLGAAAVPLLAHDSDQDRLDHGQAPGASWSAIAQFDELEARGRDTVRFSTGDAWRIRAEGDPSALAELRFFVDDGRLVVGRRKADGNRGKDTGSAVIYVTAPALHSAASAGSGTLEVDRLSGDDVSASLAGSGDMTVAAVDARKLEASLAGSGDLSLAGRAASAEFAVAGSGDLSAPGLVAGTAEASVAGSGNVRFGATGAVSASIAGSGNVEVSGTTDCTQSRIGSGRLRCSA
jgi:hypothetical protein